MTLHYTRLVVDYILEHVPFFLTEQTARKVNNLYYLTSDNEERGLPLVMAYAIDVNFLRRAFIGSFWLY